MALHIEGVTVHPDGHTSPLWEKKKTGSPLLKTVLTAAVVVSGARAGNIARHVNLESERQAHTLQVDPEEAGLDRYKRHTNERLNIRVLQPIRRSEARGSAQIGATTRSESPAETMPMNLGGYESLAAGFFGLGSFTRRKMLILTGLALLFSACAPQSITPTVIATERTPLPAATLTETLIPLINDVLTSTPGTPLETPKPPDIISYPTTVTSWESPKVYSYGGTEGRENMDGVTRAYFDRYIAELVRTNKISGKNIEEIYQNFDSKYNFKLFSTNTGLTWLVQTKSGTSFLSPKINGQPVRDLKLPYDYVFQNGVNVEVGTDNFDLQEFQANRVGFVGAWPILMNVDAHDIPINWLDMDRGGVETPIQVASAVATATVTAIPTATVTENPLAGAPEGTTAKDKDGNWIRPATNPDGTPLIDSKGKQVYETWLTFPSGPSGETISGWFENHVKDGTSIPILQEGGSVKEGLPMQFVVKDGVAAPYLKHEPLTGVEPGGFMGTVEMLLWQRYNLEQAQPVELGNFFKEIWPNNFSINLVDAQGNPHTIYSDTSFTVVLVNPLDIPEPDFSFGKLGTSGIYYNTTFDDVSHSVTILMATDKPFDTFSNQEKMKFLLNQIGHILVFPDLDPTLWKTDTSKAAQATSLATMSLKGNLPYFILSDSP